MSPIQPNTSLYLFTKDDLRYARSYNLFTNVCSEDSLVRFIYFLRKFKEYCPQSLQGYIDNLQSTNNDNFFISHRLESLCFAAYNCVELLIDASKSYYIQSLHRNGSFVINKNDSIPSKSPSSFSYKNRSILRGDSRKVSLKFDNNVYVGYIASTNNQCINICSTILNVDVNFVRELSYVNSSRNVMVHHSVVSSDDIYFRKCVLKFLNSFYSLISNYENIIYSFINGAFVFEENLS